MKITIAIDSLTAGGAQRAAVLLAEGLVARKHQITLITLFGEERDFYSLPTDITRTSLKVAGTSFNLLQAVGNNLNRLAKLRQAIDLSQPDVIISFLDKTNVLTLLACFNSNYPIIVSEQNDPTYNNIGRLWSLLRRVAYRRADRVVSCSQGVDDNWHWLDSKRREVIYNPLAITTERTATEAESELLAQLNPERQTIVAMGRLTAQKNFSLLLSAFAEVAEQFSDWQLLILGEGEQREQLEAAIAQLKLQGRVLLPGVVSNPFPILRRSQLFVLSSIYEGFGNVIIEAMACGLPVIATDCPSGPSEIITSGETGILVPNQDRDGLIAAMATLMSDRDRRKQLANSAQKALNRFELDTILSQWQNLLAEVVSNKSLNSDAG